VYASAQLNKYHRWSVPYEQPHSGFGSRGTSTSTWLDSGSGKNPCRHHSYWAEIHKKVHNVKPLYNIQSHSSCPIMVKASSDALGGTHPPIPAHSRGSPQVPSGSICNCVQPTVRDIGASGRLTSSRDSGQLHISQSCRRLSAVVQMAAGQREEVSSGLVKRRGKRCASGLYMEGVICKQSYWWPYLP